MKRTTIFWKQPDLLKLVVGVGPGPASGMLRTSGTASACALALQGLLGCYLGTQWGSRVPGVS